jgi:predicted esterase
MTDSVHCFSHLYQTLWLTYPEGAGVSDRPDPVTVVQSPIQVDIAVKIIELARSGQIAPAGRAFHRIIQVGHSLGSAITNGVMTQQPNLLDAAILTGVSDMR